MNFKQFQSLFLLFIALTILSCSSIAQVPGTLQEVDGKPYYMHKVEKSQTLYAISKLYKCKVEDIVAANPGADSGLQEGQTLKIPVEKADAKHTKVVSDAPGKSHIVHVVEKKETWYSIAQKYNVDINELMAANPQSADGLKKGQELKIPVKAAPEVKKTDDSTLPANMVRHTVQPGETLFGIAKQYAVTVEAIQSANGGLTEGLKSGSEILIPTRALPEAPATQNPKVQLVGPAFEDKYSLALCLPFFTDVADSSGLTDKERRQRDVAVNMLRGARMAADQLEKEGLKADLYIYNVCDNRSYVSNLVKKSEFAEMDLIIGPTFRDPLAEMATWVTGKDAHLVCPVPQSNKILLSSPNISKSIPSANAQWEALGEYLGSKYKSANVILVNSGILEETRAVQVFYDAFAKAAGDTCRQFRMTNKSASGLVALLSSTKENIVVMPSSDKGSITSIFKSVNRENITFYGPDDWENMEAISPEWRNKYQVHFIKPVWVDYADETVQAWIEEFRKKYKSEPTEYAFVGYDLMLYYGRGLMQFGKAFPDHYGEINQQGILAGGFDYFRTGAESGFENRFVHVLHTNDYSVLKDK